MIIDMKTVKGVTLNGQTVKYIHDLNNNQLWPYEGSNIYAPICFTSLEDNNDIYFINYHNSSSSGADTHIFYYSFDNVNWNVWNTTRMSGGSNSDYNTESDHITLNTNDKLYIKGSDNRVSTPQSYKRFYTSKLLTCSGDIRSFVPTWEETYGSASYSLKASSINGLFNWLFTGTKITTMPDMNFPYCSKETYANMFYNCQHLTQLKPIYSQLVYNSNGSASDLRFNSFGWMFMGCTGLTYIDEDIFPKISTLRYGMLRGLFKDCTNLISVNFYKRFRLSGGSSDGYGYECAEMFSGCTSLQNYWSDLDYSRLSPDCFAGMYQYCTSLVTVPQDLLPSTQLYQSCYKNLFNGCSNLEQAPDLPATDLYWYTGGGSTRYNATSCYLQMFKDCPKINRIRALFTDDITNNTNYTLDWLSGASLTGTFVKNVDATWTRTDASGTNGWNISTQPATVTLSVSSSDCDYGKISIDNQTFSCNQSKTVNYYTSVNIKATPLTSYEFTQWNDGNTDLNRTMNLTESKNYIAYFKYEPSPEPGDEYTQRTGSVHNSMNTGYPSPYHFSFNLTGDRKIVFYFYMLPGYSYNLYATINGITIWSVSGTSYNNSGNLNLFQYEDYILYNGSGVEDLYFYFTLGNTTNSSMDIDVYKKP